MTSLMGLIDSTNPWECILRSTSGRHVLDQAKPFSQFIITATLRCGLFSLAFWFLGFLLGYVWLIGWSIELEGPRIGIEMLFEFNCKTFVHSSWNLSVIVLSFNGQTTLYFLYYSSLVSNLLGQQKPGWNSEVLIVILFGQFQWLPICERRLSMHIVDAMENMIIFL